MTTDNRISIAGCGYIGKLLAQQLQNNKVPVTGFVSRDTSLAECEKRNIHCKALDFDHPLEGIDLAGQRVIYLAPPPRTGRKDTRIMNFLRAIEEQAPEKFVLISTTGVYGDCKGN